ncbi:MAG: sigma-70 family RNA polymerase sigma factor [Neptunomonas phycophila]|uniref:sigma-70 family RNA polymerase sigma factor n=1 Tax=Neptunomonas phycophila TaxID=1572645 RepID=UPI003B8E9275
MASISDYTQQLAELRPKLVTFTMLQIPDRNYAEDLVQDSIIAAIESIEKYEGKATFETWVYSILKYKLIDYIRQKKREQERFVSDENDVDIDSFFNNKAHWNVDDTPQQWHNPEELHLRTHFWEVFDFCLLHLPSSTARVFALRELMEMETEEICDSLGISEQNCWTILHRARLKLRSCLERGWFLKTGESV